jgi:preprotein translocase subunit SecG
METLLTVLHVFFCVFLILVILLQTGKGAGIGAAFGGGSQTVFGPRGAGSFIGKATGIVAALYMLSSFTLAYFSSSGSSGIAERATALNEEIAANVEEVMLEEKSTDTETAVDTATSETVPVDEADASPAPEKTADATPIEENAEEIADDTAAEAATPEKPVEKAAPAGLKRNATPPPGIENKPAAKPTPAVEEKTAPVAAPAPKPVPAPPAAEKAAPVPAAPVPAAPVPAAPAPVEKDTE